MQKSTQLKLLNDIISIIVGQNSVEIVNLLYGKKNVNEFIIAKKLNVTINQARNILYKLAEDGLVSFIRKKDKKNGGWYTYFWRLENVRALAVLKQKIIREIEGLEKLLISKQIKTFYFCPDGDVEMIEENALLYDFTCPECGKVLEIKDNREIIKEIEERVCELKKRLGLVNAEIWELEKKNMALKSRRKRTEERKKKKERENKRRLKKQAEKIMKKIPKKGLRKKDKKKKILKKIGKKKLKKKSKVRGKMSKKKRARKTTKRGKR